ncbi:MAG: ankyrin repeat domain-containing protein [Burkholderiaceae bacterium]
MTSPERDDLDQAYRQAHALTDDGRGPTLSVRANVLAAALQVAAQATARPAAEPEVKPALTPVAAPVSDVGRGRLWALNLSSWRVRSGATLCALLIVGLASWRFDASRRLGADTQVASADSKVLEMKVVEAPSLDLPPAPKDMPMPGMSPAAAYAPTPPVTVEAAAPSVQSIRAKVDARSARDKDLVVAEAEQPYHANSLAPPRTDAFTASRGSFAPPPPPQIALNAPARREAIVAGLPAPTFNDAPAPAAPSQVPAPVATAIAAAPQASTPDNVAVAAADALQRVEIAGSSIGRLGNDAVRGSLEKARKAAPAAEAKPIAASLRALPTPLHVAAGNDDVDALRKLLANPATRVDVTDAQGRTPLLLAVAAQHVAAVRLLLAAGADPDHADSTGATPRSVARSGVNAEIATLLVAPH